MKKSLHTAPHRAKLLCWQSGLYLDWKIFHYWTNEPLVHTWNLFQCIKTLKYNSRNSDSVFQKKKKKQMQNYRPYIWFSQQSKPEIHIIKLSFCLFVITVPVIQTHYTCRFPIFNSKANNYVVFELNISLCITFKWICIFLNTEICPNVPECINYLMASLNCGHISNVGNREQA